MCYNGEMRSIISLLVMTFLSLATAGSASPIADVICAPKARMEQKLRIQFGNSPLAMGVRSPTEVMEVWTGEAGDWTLVITYASGRSCIVAMGEDWQSFEKKKPV